MNGRAKGRKCASLLLEKEYANQIALLQEEPNVM